MSDGADDATTDATPPMPMDDWLAQRAYALCHVGRLATDTEDGDVHTLALEMMRKLINSVRVSSTADIRTIK